MKTNQEAERQKKSENDFIETSQEVEDRRTQKTISYRPAKRQKTERYGQLFHEDQPESRKT